MLIDTFKGFIRSKKLLNREDNIFLAVSGGVDSMVMLDLFSTAEIKVSVAHCNFNLRGAESDQDSDFVREQTRKLGVQYFEKTFETKEFATVKKFSIQEAARVLRYQWFEELCKSEGFHYYATAHHFDDQLETFFINLFRGTGVRGLRGILPKNGNCIRPLLFATREEIVEYAINRGISFREDSSNKSDKYLRNRIRHLILPALASVKADYRSGFNKTFQLLAGSEEFIDVEITKLRKQLFREEEDQVHIAIEELNKLPNTEYYLYELLKPYGFNEDVVRKIPAALNKIPGKIFLSKSHQLLIDRNNIILTPIQETKPESFLIQAGQIKIINPIRLTFTSHPENEKTIIDPNPNVAQLDAGKLQFPLKLRKWEEGDYFFPLGMNGRKKVSDYFIDRKFSLLDKQKTWLLLSGDEIAWIVGHRIDDRFKIELQTKSVFTISFSGY
jgi:tRNA(Ile)-lysidine synthase